MVCRGGGLMAGVAAAVKAARPNVVVVGCQPAASPVMHESVRAGRVVEYTSSPTLSEGTAGGIEPGAVTLPLCAELVDHWVVVGEQDIEWGVAAVWRQLGVMVEGAAGLAVAAVKQCSELVAGKTVCAILCGGNIDAETHSGVLRAVAQREKASILSSCE